MIVSRRVADMLVRLGITHREMYFLDDFAQCEQHCSESVCCTAAGYQRDSDPMRRTPDAAALEALARVNTRRIPAPFPCVRPASIRQRGDTVGGPHWLYVESCERLPRSAVFRLPARAFAS